MFHCEPLRIPATLHANELCMPIYTEWHVSNVVPEGDADVVLVVLLQPLHSEAVVRPPKPLHTDGTQEGTGAKV